MAESSSCQRRGARDGFSALGDSNTGTRSVCVSPVSRRNSSRETGAGGPTHRSLESDGGLGVIWTNQVSLAEALKMQKFFPWTIDRTVEMSVKSD